MLRSSQGRKACSTPHRIQASAQPSFVSLSNPKVPPCQLNNFHLPVGNKTAQDIKKNKYEWILKSSCILLTANQSHSCHKKPTPLLSMPWAGNAESSGCSHRLHFCHLIRIIYATFRNAALGIQSLNHPRATQDFH